MAEDGWATQESWAEPLYDRLVASGVSIFAYVPDAGHRVLIDRSLGDSRVRSVPLTTEEEGVALVAGAHLGGARAVLLMQSSGVGNTVNMLSLIANGRFPFLAFVTMRGTFGERNRWQIPMGRAVRPVLEAMGVTCIAAGAAADVAPCTDAAIAMAYGSDQAVAVLLDQRLIGAKTFGPDQ
jgi:sulfopyruvate decarboxylase alpha subunit